MDCRDPRKEGVSVVSAKTTVVARVFDPVLIGRGSGSNRLLTFLIVMFMLCMGLERADGAMGWVTTDKTCGLVVSR
jgi:hypothetical protein